MQNIKNLHTHTRKFISMHTICYKNYKQTLLKISENICEIQQKKSERMNVSIHFFKKPTKFLKIYKKNT